MNYSSFVKLRGVGCVALIAAPIAFFVFRPKASTAPIAPPTVAVSPNTETADPPRPAGDGVAEGSLSDVDREVLKMQKEPLARKRRQHRQQNQQQGLFGSKWNAHQLSDFKKRP